VPTDPLIGTPYRALRELGRGGMSEVFEAEHIALAKRVVVKVLHKHLSLRADQVSRLKLEGQALAHLSHPNIVSVTDLQITPDGRPYLVMERLDGRTLRGEREARRFLPIEEAVTIARQALAGLGAAHEAGIVHRDVKLDNIFLCGPTDPAAPRVVKLLDFGLAKVLESRREGAPAPLPVGTGEDVMLGTPRFFSPEQATFGPVDQRTDIYAMGVVLYTLVAGRGPFEHLSTVLDLLQAHAWTEPAPPSSYAPQCIPPELEEVIRKALEKRPADRFPSTSSFSDALEVAVRPRPRWASTEPMPAGAVVDAASPRRRRWAHTEPMPTLRVPGAAAPPDADAPPDPTKPR
jgi:eukaryotic-like serine/threonine-protein kinase